MEFTIVNKEGKIIRYTTKQLVSRNGIHSKDQRIAQLEGIVAKLIEQQTNSVTFVRANLTEEGEQITSVKTN